MDERVVRLKTSQDARQLAENALRLGREDVAAQSLQRARELQAVEEGYNSPAEVAIASALYAYEEEQSRIKGRTFRANRTRHMLAKRGALEAAERMVMNRQRSTGFEVLEEAGLRELSFEAIVDRFPDEFSTGAVVAARARLSGEPAPAHPRKRKAQIVAQAALHELQPAFLDAEAYSFLSGFRDPNSRHMSEWLPSYSDSIHTISAALAAGREADLFETFWKRADNDIAHAGQGLLAHVEVDSMRTDLIQVIRDIYEDGSSANFDRIVERFQRWKDEERVTFIPRLLVARAFAAIHPHRYHTTVDAGSQKEILQWFAEHTGFTGPRQTSWCSIAEALASHIDRTKAFDNDVYARNIFPWFVVEQLRARTAPKNIRPGHVPRVEKTTTELQPNERTIRLRHNALQTVLYSQLAAQYGAENVWTEFPTGTGGYADAIVRNLEGTCHLYEIKVAETASEVVRQAMGQLLEYAFRKGGLEPVRLFAVGEPLLDKLTEDFIERLNTQFKLSMDYLRVAMPAEANS